CFFICHFLFLNETTQYGMQIKCHAVSKRFYQKNQLVIFCHSEKDNFLTLNWKPARQFSVSCFWESASTRLGKAFLHPGEFGNRTGADSRTIMLWKLIQNGL
ncbi:MAG: hypothetical protein AB2687_20455, partial [Candidatus Thiodiazotropha taylori]